MRIASISEDKKIEKRIAITPEAAKKYLALGLEVLIPENYGSHLGFKNKEYKDLGVKVLAEESEILKNTDIIIQLGLLPDDKISQINEKQILIGTLNPYFYKEKIDTLVKKKN